MDCTTTTTGSAAERTRVSLRNAKYDAGAATTELGYGSTWKEAQAATAAYGKVAVKLLAIGYASVKFSMLRLSDIYFLWFLHHRIGVDGVFGKPDLGAAGVSWFGKETGYDNEGERGLLGW